MTSPALIQRPIAASQLKIKQPSDQPVHYKASSNWPLASFEYKNQLENINPKHIENNTNAT